MKIHIQRTGEINSAMMGKLTGENLPVMETLEDAWRQNQRSISCIPAGTYICTPHGWEPNSGYRFKKTWLVNGVPNRSAILIHAGNTHVDTHGCILVGLLSKGSRLIHSLEAMNLLRKVIGKNQFELVIDGPK